MVVFQKVRQFWKALEVNSKILTLKVEFVQVLVELWEVFRAASYRNHNCFKYRLCTTWNIFIPRKQNERSCWEIDYIFEYSLLREGKPNFSTIIIILTWKIFDQNSSSVFLHKLIDCWKFVLRKVIFVLAAILKW